MRIAEKLMMDMDGLRRHGPITIVAFGDSVTHGAVATDEVNYETAYWNRLRQKLNAVRNYVPINVINAGIGGDCAREACDRMEHQVFAHQPDLVIVCFGLNDVNRELNEYIDPLRTIFERCKQSDADTIFMTPNMLNTYVADDTFEGYRDYAAVTAEMQNSGKMDRYMAAAIALAEEMGVTVCDCYREWKRLSETEDTTLLLANRINHPTREMHELFAQKLFETILGGASCATDADSSTMYKG